MNKRTYRSSVSHRTTRPTFRPAPKPSKPRRALPVLLAVPLAVLLLVGGFCGSYAATSVATGNGFVLPDASAFQMVIDGGVSTVGNGIDGIVGMVTGKDATPETKTVTVTLSTEERNEDTLSVSPSYYSVLSPDEREAYDSIRQSIYDGTYDGGENSDYSAWPEVSDGVSMGELSRGWDALLDDDPYISARIGGMDRTIYRQELGGLLNSSTRYAIQTDDDSQIIDWADSPVTPDEAVAKCRERAKAIADMCWRDAKGDERQFVWRVFYYLSSYVTYSSNDGKHTNDIYGALVLGDSKCWGMSCAMKAILDEKGVECRIISGERSTGGSHAWNMVKVDGHWYACDVTNGSGSWHDNSTVYSGKSFEAMYGVGGGRLSASDAVMRGCLFGLDRMNDEYKVDTLSLQMLGWAK